MEYSGRQIARDTLDFFSEELCERIANTVARSLDDAENFGRSTGKFHQSVNDHEQHELESFFDNTEEVEAFRKLQQRIHAANTCSRHAQNELAACIIAMREVIIARAELACAMDKTDAKDYMTA